MTAPPKNEELHGNVPDHTPVALLLIDVINDLEFPGGDRLFPHALAMAERLATLKQRAEQAGIATIYVNDNFGRWRSDFKTQVRHCLDDGVPGRPIAALLEPEDDDYFVLKPKHSGFYCTALDLLLRYLGTTTLILTGIAGNSCVLFTAHDAFMRDYHLYVPADCCASISAQDNQRALDTMRGSLDADTRCSADLDLAAIVRQAANSTP